MTLTDSISAKAGASAVSAIASSTTAFRQFMCYLSTTISSAITGAIGLGKNGIGTLTLTGANTYSGVTSINAGTLKAGSTTGLSGNSAMNISTGATLDLGGFNNSISSLATATGTITDSSIAGSGGILRILTAMPAATTAQLLTGSVGLQIFGGNTTTSILTNTANTYSGGTIVGNGSGTISTRLFATGIIGSGSPGAVTNGIYGKGTITIGAVTTDRSQFYFVGAATINNNIIVNSANGTGLGGEIGAFRVESSGSVIAGNINANLANAIFIAMNGAGRTIRVNGVISGNSGVIVTTVGAGNITVTFAGINSYLGSTSINSGTLITAAIISGTSGKFSQANFTNTTLTVTFSVAPLAGETYQLFPGATTQIYPTISLVGATGRTAIYNSLNSTLTIA
jgi:fibronectin-binding autotransporter adhesin